MIELKQIRKDYGERTVIKNQSLSIKDKEFFVLIGPSGSGKTTLLKLINCLIDPTEGDVLLNGNPSWTIRFANYGSIRDMSCSRSPFSLI